MLVYRRVTWPFDEFTPEEITVEVAGFGTRVAALGFRFLDPKTIIKAELLPARVLLRCFC